jgi:hypothetical protein
MTTNDSNIDPISRTSIGASQDSILAGGLLTAATWGPWLAEFNQVLSALSLIIGIMLGLARLWLLMRKKYTNSR